MHFDGFASLTALNAKVWYIARQTFTNLNSKELQLLAGCGCSFAKTCMPWTPSSSRPVHIYLKVQQFSGVDCKRSLLSSLTNPAWRVVKSHVASNRSLLAKSP